VGRVSGSPIYVLQKSVGKNSDRSSALMSRPWEIEEHEHVDVAVVTMKTKVSRHAEMRKGWPSGHDGGGACSYSMY
jgi:hypothetical protein